MARQVVLTDKERALRSLLLEVSEFIHAEKHLPRPELRITGGWVRDKLLGSSSKDIDIGIDSMTGHKFALFMQEFMNEPSRLSTYGDDAGHKIAKIAANPEKSKHLETATTTIFGLDIDLVNLRKESYADDSRNPQMENATAEEDALRRDSTVNALFYNLQTEKVEDFTGRGLKDLDEKIIRTPLEPYQTFKDDPLRILRSIRFASKLGYSIEPSDLECMKDKTIQEALRAKISRERIGIEIEKMLKGPDPLEALELINQQDLYCTIFTDPTHPKITPERLSDWRKSYRFIHSLLNDATESDVLTLRRILLPQTEDVYDAWVLAALSPWSTMRMPEGTKAKAKGPTFGATAAAREGLKADNKTMRIVNHAVEHHEEIVAVKNAFWDEVNHVDVHAKRKHQVCSREGLGMAIRRWSSDWRSSVIYAILLEVMQQANPRAVTSKYAPWLQELERLQLLEAYNLKPLVDGKKLMAALDKKAGPWLSNALDMVLEWQLRNPNSDDPELAIKEVRERIGD